MIILIIIAYILSTIILLSITKFKYPAYLSNLEIGGMFIIGPIILTIWFIIKCLESVGKFVRYLAER